MTEKQFSTKLKNKTKDRWHILSLESVGGAVPDLLITPKGKKPFLCELKIVPWNKVRGTTVSVIFQRGQTKYLTDYTLFGSSCVAIYCEKTSRIYFYDGTVSKLVERMRFGLDGSISTAPTIAVIDCNGDWMKQLDNMVESWI